MSQKIVFLPSETDIISQKMNTRKLFFPIFLLWTFPACFAQSTTSQGPKIKMDVAARLAVLADDDRYLCFSAVDRNGQNKDDEMFIVVYDKVSRTVVQDHEIDEDYGFSSAFIRGDNVVLEGSKYNKKTKSVDFFQYAFPVKEKRKGRVVTTTVYSVPAVGMKQSFSLILHSPDKQKLAYVTYLKPQKRNLDGYTIDVNVCDLAGTEINRVSATISGLCPFFGKGFLSNDGIVYLEEHIKDNRYRYVTFTSGEVKYVPSEELVEDFETMTANSKTNDTNVEGRFTSWSFNKSGVRAPGEGKCNGTNSVMMKKPSTIATTQPLSHDFFMAQGTFDGYIDGMVDTTGQPIGRVNYGIDGGETYRFGGKNVETVEDDVITAYDDASTGDVIAVFGDLRNYAVNSNMQMRVVKWSDHDNNKEKTKAIMIVDGKVLDPNGFLIIKKGA